MIDLYSWASAMHIKIAWGNIEDVNQALDEFQTLHDAGSLNELQLMKLEEWRSENLVNHENMNSVILLAYSTSGKTRKLVFDLDGLKVTTLLPPCYGDGGQSWQYEMTIEKNLSDYFSDSGYQVKRLAGPYKNLAAKLGLGKYGRNNLMYVEGLGSYIRMVGFVTNAELIPALSLHPNPAKITLDTCDHCRLCRESCPTQAIGNDRFLLHVDRCLAYQNEKKESKVDDPSWTNSHCLVGCLKCQNICPHNQEHSAIGSISTTRFNRQETAYILAEGSDNLQKTIDNVYQKLENQGLARHRDYILRNLQVLIKNFKSCQ